MTYYYIIKSKIAILHPPFQPEFAPELVKTQRGSESGRPEEGDYIDINGRFFVVEFRVWTPSALEYQWNLAIYGHWLRPVEV